MSAKNKDPRTREEKKKSRLGYYYPHEIVRDYRAQLTVLRHQWRQETIAAEKAKYDRLKSEREEIQRDKLARRARKKVTAAKGMEKQEKLRVAADLAHRERIRQIIEVKAGQRELRKARQRSLVNALEAESRLWLTSESIDEKICESFFEQPGTTGLITRNSHNWWRYTADSAEFQGPGIKDLDVSPTVSERMRVSTATEMLIRTQTTSLAEYFDALQDGAEIANAIADLEIQNLSNRNYRQTPSADTPGVGFAGQSGFNPQAGYVSPDARDAAGAAARAADQAKAQAAVEAAKAAPDERPYHPG